MTSRGAGAHRGAVLAARARPLTVRALVGVVPGTEGVLVGRHRADRGRASLFPSGLASEDQRELTAHVVRSEPGGQEPDGPQSLVVLERTLQDGVLGPEAGQRWDVGDGQPARWQK